jgi:hypothetical protein
MCRQRYQRHSRFIFWMNHLFFTSGFKKSRKHTSFLAINNCVLLHSEPVSRHTEIGPTMFQRKSAKLNQWKIRVVVEPHVTRSCHVQGVAVGYEWQFVPLGKITNLEDGITGRIETDGPLSPNSAARILLRRRNSPKSDRPASFERLRWHHRDRSNKETVPPRH